MDGCHSSLQEADGAMSYSAVVPSSPIGARARRTEAGGGRYRAKRTSLGDVPATMGTFYLNHFKAGRCLMESAAGTRSI